jgi:hypothetical protein
MAEQTKLPSRAHELGGGDGWALGGGVAPELRSREDRGLGICMAITMWEA